MTFTAAGKTCCVEDEAIFSSYSLLRLLGWMVQDFVLPDTVSTYFECPFSPSVVKAVIRGM